MTRVQWFDALERILWTVLQVVTADAVVQFAGWDTKWIVPLAAVFAIIKNVLATRFGNGTSSTLPASVEPLPATTSSDGVAAVVTTLPEGTSNDTATP